jgi:hypothetical protein
MGPPVPSRTGGPINLVLRPPRYSRPAMTNPVTPRPREPRDSVFLTAELVGFGGGGPTVHRVRNISPHGACIDRAEQRRRGETVAISIGHVADVGATVVWVDRGLAGLRFAHRIALEQARARAAIPPKPTGTALGPALPGSTRARSA